MIEIRDLFKYYGPRRAVGPVSAAIEKGEIVGLLGLNGAGKTTTLRILACDLLPSSGSVRVDGIDVVEHPEEVRKRIGYLPDVPPLYGEMRVHEYLRYAARLRGVPGGDATSRVREVERETGIEDVHEELIASLSHGYRQRVGIAQAIVHRPRLVVLDEPIGGLDPVQIVDMRRLVRKLGGEHTVIVSSHILSEISETCDRIFVIRDGEIVASGTEEELSQRLLEGVSVEITVKGVAAGVLEALENVSGVVSVEAADATEPGEGVASFRVRAGSDVRDALAKAVVEAGFGLLGLSRSERELESVFIRLAGPGGADDDDDDEPPAGAAANAGGGP